MTSLLSTYIEHGPFVLWFIQRMAYLTVIILFWGRSFNDRSIRDNLASDEPELSLPVNQFGPITVFIERGRDAPNPDLLFRPTPAGGRLMWVTHPRSDLRNTC